MRANNTLGYSAMGVFNYATSQVANRVVGLDTKFSWSNLAASVIGSNIAGQVGQYVKVDGFGGSVLRGQISAQSAAWVRDKWFGGGRPDYGQVAADAFGNALADYTVGQLRDGARKESSNYKYRDAQGRELTAEVLGKDAYNQKYGYSVASIGDIAMTQYESEIVKQASREGWFNVLSSPPDGYFDFRYGGYSGAEMFFQTSEYSPSYLDRASEYMRSARVADQARLTNDVESSKGFGEVYARTMRAVDAAGFDVVDGVLGIAQLATSSKAQNAFLDSLGALMGYVLEHPREAIGGAAGTASKYLTTTGPAQMTEDGLRFGLGVFAGGGGAKGAISLIEEVAQSVSSIGRRSMFTLFSPSEGVLKNTGARKLLADDFDGWMKADLAYDRIRDDVNDVFQISANTGWSLSRIERIKNHVFFNVHELPEGRMSRFDSDPQIVNAWSRLTVGDYVQSDIDLLRHEIFESKFEGIFKADYNAAHSAAIRSGRNWILE